MERFKYNLVIKFTHLFDISIERISTKLGGNMRKVISLVLMLAMLLPMTLLPVDAHAPSVWEYDYNFIGTDGSSSSRYHLHYTDALGNDYALPSIGSASIPIDYRWVGNHTINVPSVLYPGTDLAQKQINDYIAPAYFGDSEPGLIVPMGTDYWLELQDGDGNTISGVSWSVYARSPDGSYIGNPVEKAAELINITSNGKLSAQEDLAQEKYAYFREGVNFEYEVKVNTVIDEVTGDITRTEAVEWKENRGKGFIGFLELILVGRVGGTIVFQHYLTPWHTIGGNGEHVYLNNPDDFMKMVDKAGDPVIVPYTNEYGVPELKSNGKQEGVAYLECDPSCPYNCVQLEMPVYLVGSRKQRDIQAWVDPPYIKYKDVKWSINDNAYEYLNINPHKDSVAVVEANSHTMETGVVEGISTTVYDYLIEQMGYAKLVPSNIVKDGRFNTTISTTTVTANHLDPGLDYRLSYLVAAAKAINVRSNMSHADAILKIVRSIDYIDIYKEDEDETAPGVKPLDFMTMPITKTQELKAFARPNDAYSDWKEIQWFVSDENGNEFTDSQGNPLRDSKGRYQVRTAEGELELYHGTGERPAALDILNFRPTVSFTGNVNSIVQAIGPGTAYIKAKSSELQDNAYSLVEILVPIESGEIFFQGGIRDIYIPVGEVKNLVVEFYPPNTTIRDLVWWIQNPENPADTSRPQANRIASVSSGGSITGFSAGDTIVYVATADGMHITSCRVHIIIPATDITITPTQCSMKIGSSVTVGAVVLPLASNNEVLWSSDNPIVATVDKNGKVTAVSPGKANIIASSVADVSQGGVAKTASCEITVTQDVQALTLDKTSVLMDKGSTAKLEARVVPSTATNAELDWISNNTSVVTVDSFGNITALGNGTTTIKVVVRSNPSISATCVVQVIEAITAIVLEPGEFTLNKGQSGSITATVLPTNVAGSYLNWRSSNTSVAVVSNAGIVTAVGKGTATITASNANGSIFASSEVTVVENATSVILNKTQLTLDKGASEALTASLVPASADAGSIKWTSSNNTVATVTETGTVTAVTTGYATIYVTLSNGSVGAWCSVHVEEPLTGLKITPDKADLKIGETVSLYATAEPINASNKSVVWYTSNPNIATVDPYGLVTAHALGTVTITAMALNNSGISTTITVNIKAIAVSSIALNKTSANLGKGESLQLIATVEPADASNSNVKWTSNDDKIATVSSNGKVVAVSGGTATITVTSEDGKKTATCVININEVSVVGLTLDKSAYTLGVGQSSTLIASVVPLTASNKKVTWSTSNSAIVTVDANGNIFGGMPGIATVTATSEDGGKTASCSVTVVTPVALTGISVKSTTKLSVNGTETLIVAFNPANATNTAVTWVSSDPTTVSVDSNGKLTGLKEGTATITITSVEGKFIATCIVTVEVAGNKAVSNMTQLIGSISSSERNKVVTLESITKAAENEVAKAAGINSSDAVLTINASFLQRGLAQATAIKSSLETTISGYNLGLPRDIKTGIQINSDQKTKLTININSSSASSVDFVSVVFGDYKLIFSKKSVQENTRDRDLVISLEVIGTGDQRQLIIGLNKQLAEPFTVSTKPITGSTLYQTLINGSGTPVVTGYNSVENRNEAVITEAGSYRTIQNSKSFNDINGKSIEMQEAIKVLAAKGIITGKTATTFDPDGSITRAEIAALIIRMLSKIDDTSTVSFTDVRSSDWFYSVVHAASNAKYVEGVGNNRFEPNVTIPKDQIITIIARVLTNEKGYYAAGSSYLDRYSDRSSIASWAQTPVALATKCDLVDLDEGQFKGASKMTRGNAAIILYRLFKLL